MAENMVPVVINATAFISAQYKQVLAGVKAAAGKAGKIAHVFTEDGFDALDTGKWPPVMIATGTSLPFLRRGKPVLFVRLGKSGPEEWTPGWEVAQKIVAEPAQTNNEAALD